MHAFLIVGKSQEEREKEIAKRIMSWKISSWDTIRLPQENTVGIAHIRDFVRSLQLIPQNSPAKVGVLDDIQRLTIEAQNALLKTLEEPPPNTYILAHTATPDALLSTVLSRFSVINLGESSAMSDDKNVKNLIEKLFAATPGKRIQILDPMTGTRDEAKLLVTSLLFASRSMLLAAYTSGQTHHLSPQKLAAFTHALLTAQSQLSVNVNPKLVVDNVILHLAC